jgi:hypothetical protein
MKKFLIIGNMNAVTYNEIFKLFQEEKMFVRGRGNPSGMWFRVPEDDKKVHLGNIMWFTNLQNMFLDNPILELTNTYCPTKYPKYDNCDAIEVSRTRDIPKDYDGVMGVPISFLDKYNPKQFEVLGIGQGENKKNLTINNREIYKRLFIRRR